MRGGYIHNNVLIPAILAHLRAFGADISVEHPVRVGARRGAVDVFADFGSKRVVFEAETSCRRAAWDVDKFQALGADALVILVPNSRVADACRREIRRKLAAKKFPGLGIYVLTLPAAHQWLSNYSRLISVPIETSVSKTLPGIATNSPSTPESHI